MPPRTHQHPHLVRRLFERSPRRSGLHIDRHRLRRTIALLVRRQRNARPSYPGSPRTCSPASRSPPMIVYGAPSTRSSCPIGSVPGNKLSWMSDPMMHTCDACSSSVSVKSRPFTMFRFCNDGICHVYPRIVESVTDSVPCTTLATVACCAPRPMQCLQFCST